MQSECHLLAVTEQVVFLVAGLDGRAAELKRCSCQLHRVLLITIPSILFLLLLEYHMIGVPYLGNQHSVANSNAHGDALAITVQTTGSNSEDLGLVELLDAGLGQEDAASCLGLGLDALDKHTVQEGSESTDGADGRLWICVSDLFELLCKFGLLL